MEKLTQRNAFNMLLGLSQVQENAELVQFLNHRIEMLDNKNTNSSKGLTKTQKENEEIKTSILDFMKVDTLYSATEIANALGLTSGQKASALLKQLVEVGKVERIKEKGATKFQLIKVD